MNPLVSDHDTLNAARAAVGLALVSSMRAGGGTPEEADSRLNDASRALVSAYHAVYGEAWIGEINQTPDARARGTIWLWDEKPLPNFGAGFVCPAFDKELVRLIEERDRAPYTGTKDDSVRVLAILERLAAIGGESLAWS